MWKTGRYRSYPPSVLVDLTARILALVPPWTRVYRVQRSVHAVRAMVYTLIRSTPRKCVLTRVFSEITASDVLLFTVVSDGQIPCSRTKI